MQKAFIPETRVPGATRRIDPETLMPESDKRGRPLWNMPAPTGYVQHKRRSKRGVDMVQVPIYRATSASYARWVKSQIRRNQRKAAEVQAEVDALNAAEQNSGEQNAEQL